MGSVKVLYKSARGIMSFDRKKPIFQHKNSKVHLETGLGVVKDEGFVDKGRFAFAEIVNVFSVLPDIYLTIDYFENIGVPQKIYKGVYGRSVFIKEEYLDKTLIKALDKDGNILIHENMKIKKGTFNMYYSRLNNVIGEWEDITDFVITKIIGSIESKKCDINLGNPYILYSLRTLCKNKIEKTSNGVIYVTGNHESLVLWGNNNKASMAWLGRTVEIDGIKSDVREEIEQKVIENGFL